ncbi:odorant receptor 49a-like [Musca autumnalis]|uniref:odorant receptor 49a-like n=1 Tax=Musca autumnalis TaxID=221902 RepID=UPI003CE9A702
MTEIERYFEDFIHLPRVLLKTLGYDFPGIARPLPTKCLMRLYFMLALISCLYCTYFVAKIALSEVANGVQDLPLLLSLIDDILHNGTAILKSYYFLCKIKSQEDLYQRLREIYPASLDDRMAYCVNDYYWPKWIRKTIYIQFCAITLIVLLPLAETLIEYIMALLKVGYADAEFAYHILYEDHNYFMNHQSPLGYVLVYLMLTMGTHYAIIFNICPDIWLVAYAMQLCMHFDYISNKLKNYEPEETKTERDLEVIAELVRKHQILLELANDLREIFSFLVLFMLFSTVATLFGPLIFILTQGVNLDINGYLAFLPTNLGQYFMVRYYGQQIINKVYNLY